MKIYLLLLGIITTLLWGCTKPTTNKLEGTWRQSAKYKNGDKNDSMAFSTISVYVFENEEYSFNEGAGYSENGFFSTHGKEIAFTRTSDNYTYSVKVKSCKNKLTFIYPAIEYQIWEEYVKD